MEKTKGGRFRDASEIENLKKGTEVILIFDTEEDYTGIFQETDDEEIIIKSLDSVHTIGLPRQRLIGYLERIK